MKSEDFKALWKDIEGNPINIEYGKTNHWKNKILQDYNEMFGTVYIKYGSSIFVRSIKSIELLQPKEISAVVPVVELPAEEVIVTPRLPDNWNENGHFIFTGCYGGNWKVAQIRNKAGEVLVETDKTFYHKDLFNKVRALKLQFKDSPNILIDDTFAAPTFYKIKKGVCNDFFFEKIVN